MRPSVGALGGRPEVQGVRQVAQGAAPSLASLEPPGSLPGTQKSERGPAVRGVDLGQLCNHCLPGSSVALGGGGGGGRGGMLCDAE